MSIDSSDQPLLRVHDLTITHDGNVAPAPTHVSFDVRAGEVVLVLGPSGAGKSTLALALNGLIPHDIPADISGTVSIAGLTAPQATPAELSRHVAMVFQDPDSQLVTASVYDDVAFGPENLLLPVDEIHSRVEAALRRVSLWDKRNANPDTLSGGGRQRLAIACALAMGSEVIVLDEPTANLDPQGIEDVYAALADVVATRDRAVVLVEHNLDAAIGLITRILVLNAAGEIAFDGAPDHILRENAARLYELGVWLPEATLAALHVREAGFAIDSLPLTAAELAAALPPRTPVNAKPPTPVTRDSVIAVTELSFDRGGTTVLDDISVSIEEGSFTAIVGENGAGKTTLLQLMCGVLRPPRGSIVTAGVDPGRVHARDLANRVGFVFQNPEHQFMATTVFDELAYELRARKRPSDEIQERVTSMLARFGLSDKAQTHPFLLSGGQKRRLSVGTALLSGARILALDEPTFGQDRAGATELLQLLQQLQHSGTTIVVVTHDMQLVADYATHMIALSKGRLLTSGTTQQAWADSDALTEIGLRLPPVQRALRSRPDYADVWDLRDVLSGGRR